MCLKWTGRHLHFTHLIQFVLSRWLFGSASAGCLASDRPQGLSRVVPWFIFFFSISLLWCDDVLLSPAVSAGRASKRAVAQHCCCGDESAEPLYLCGIWERHAGVSAPRARQRCCRTGNPPALTPSPALCCCVFLSSSCLFSSRTMPHCARTHLLIYLYFWQPPVLSLSLPLKLILI